MYRVVGMPSTFDVDLFPRTAVPFVGVGATVGLNTSMVSAS